MPLEWKNTPDLYNDYVHWYELDWRMAQILLNYDWFFDEQYFYWHVRHSDIVKRRPLYWWPQKSTPSEKKRH